ncbi:MAG: sigma-70 family RNA polymerase sigma factor, partial [Alphaproteobacteria bacterium]
YQSSILAIARNYVNTPATAEDVAQDTWIAVLRGAEKFEGRSSFKTWLFQIAANRARRTGTREHRVISVDPVDPVASSRFNSGGMWNEPPEPFTELLAKQLDNANVLRCVREAISKLPDPQKSVVTLRDVEGLSTNEVANILDLSVGNTRVLLHRARAVIRTSLEEFKGAEH